MLNGSLETMSAFAVLQAGARLVSQPPTPTDHAVVGDTIQLSTQDLFESALNHVVRSTNLLRERQFVAVATASGWVECHFEKLANASRGRIAREPIFIFAPGLRA